MAADTQVLREYLVALGFKINERDFTKLGTSMGTLDKKAMLLGKAVIGVATSVVTMTTLFAKQMERLYYSSRYADTTVANMQAIEFAGGQIGLKAGQAANAIKNMTAAMRSNPGLVGLLEGKLGVKVRGRDHADVLLDLIAQLKTMPFYVAERFAALFGMDAETLFNMEEGLEKMRKAKALRKEMANDMGIDPDAAAKKMVEYMNLWDQLKERVGLFGQAVAIAAEGPIMALMRKTEKVLTDWALIAKYAASGQETPKETIKKGFDSIAGNKLPKALILGAKVVSPAAGAVLDHVRMPSGQQVEDVAKTGRDVVDATAEAAKALKQRRGQVGLRGLVTDALEWNWPLPDAGLRAKPDVGDTSLGGKDDFSPVEQGEDAGDTSLGGKDDFSPAEQGATGEDLKRKQEFLAALEKQYALPEGWLDRMWQKESGRGAAVFNKKSKAKGDFQFIPATQKEYGLTNESVYDFEAAAKAAARKSKNVLRWAKGDTRLAAAAYNYGEGNLDAINRNLGRAPRETQEYADAVGGSATTTLNQENNIHIHGVTEPQEAGTAAGREVSLVGAELLRNGKMKMR